MVNQYAAIVIEGRLSGAEARCPAHESHPGWQLESASSDFQELRQDFSPTDSGKKDFYG